MKTCTQCSIPKTEDNFYRCVQSRDNLHAWCKACFKSAYKAGKNDPTTTAKRAWNSITNRTTKHKRYQSVKVLMTQTQFLDWAVPAFTEWMASNPGLRPTVDRIRPEGHYELGNIRVLERGQNSRLARKNHNVHAPENQAWCGGCECYKPVEEFSKNKNRYNGLQQYCNTCRSTSRRKPGTSGSEGAARS